MKDFKGFVDEVIDLDRSLVVLAGPNGSGKSSVLDALCMLGTEILANIAALRRRGRSIRGKVPETGDVRHSASSATLEVTVAAGGDERNVSLQLQIDPSTGSLNKPSQEAIDAGLVSFFSKAGEQLPLFFSYAPERRVDRTWRNSDKDALPEAGHLLDAVVDAIGGDLGYDSFLRWFREREDIENESKVARKDLSFEDPQLRAVRAAVSSMLPGYGEVRMQREPLHLLVSKGDQTLTLDQLSDGEKNLITMVGDIARRLAIANPERSDPLQAEAVVLVDEIELHLHPAWQRRVVGALRRTFPGCQLILSTHSPQVLSEVPTESIIVLDRFTVKAPGAPTAGRDSNAILSEVMDVSERPRAELEELRRISSLIDQTRYAEASAAVDELAGRLTERDGEIVRLRTMLHFMEGEDCD
ncbi:MAG: AAA family ATPase [Deltaproteobacteria bacterium]|nr:AAA family ATPase [Deltaproteobacteria bacterium]